MSGKKTMFKGHSINACMNRALGSDAEFMIKTRSGRTVPATLVLEDQKKASASTYSKVFNDGRQGEFAVNCSTCREILTKNMLFAINDAKGQIREHNFKHGTDLRMAVGSFAEMTFDDIISGGEECLKSGCKPDLDAYTCEQMPPIQDYHRQEIVICGCHIHATIEQKIRGDIGAISEIIRLCDAFCGIPITMAYGGKQDKMRRRFGGLAGRFRMTPYGLEYRTPGGTTLKYPAFTSLAAAGVRTAIAAATLKDGKKFPHDDLDFDTIREAINSSDPDLASDVWYGCIRGKLMEFFKPSGAFPILEGWSPPGLYNNLATFEFFCKNKSRIKPLTWGSMAASRLSRFGWLKGVQNGIQKIGEEYIEFVTKGDYRLKDKEMLAISVKIDDSRNWPSSVFSYIQENSL